MSGERLDNRDQRTQSTGQQEAPESIDSGRVLHAASTTTTTVPTPAAPPAKRRRTTRPATAKPTRTASTSGPATPEGKLTGVVGDASSTGSRSGEDVRKRGWFWHWNSIVTQYAPLIGLKGVGLLNSYTVWTDRREESPHRGYAFPSQQSEADFYGEDRAELITINKILVALDLIEIRKEMVLRVDGQGRRWKVPHNLYRVKDHGDDVSLTTKDVMRVVELAGKDRAVYRYLRRIFSPRFDPIDRDNVWHQILVEARQTETWQRLAARTERDESKASARSKAGHAARRGNDDSPVFSLPKSGDKPTSAPTVTDSGNSESKDSNDSATVATHPGGEDTQTSVAGTNTGLTTDVEPGNNGLDENRPSTVAPANTGQPTSVGLANTTYYQDLTTTTEGNQTSSEGGVRTEQQSPTDRFGTERAPDSTRSEDHTRILFEEANSRPSSPAERRQLRNLAERVTTMGFSSESDPWILIGAAIEDAVGAGSAFVAPKRIREILLRWSRDGVPAEYAHNVSTLDVRDGQSRDVIGSVTSGSQASHRSVPDVAMPNGMASTQVWEAVEQAVRAQVGSALAGELFAATAIVGYDAGEVTIAVAAGEQHEAFTLTHRDLVIRSLRMVLRRPIRLTVIEKSPDPDGDRDETERVTRRGGAPGERRSARRERLHPAPVVTMGAMPVFSIERCGMTNRQVWVLVLNELREGGSVARADVDAWLRDAVVLAVDETGEGEARVQLGVPHVLAKRRVEGRFLAPVRQGLARMLDLDSDPAIEVVLIRDWLQRAVEDDQDRPEPLVSRG